MAEKHVNYTDEQEELLRSLYAEHGTVGLATVVETFNEAFPDNVKNIKSIRGKIMTLKNDDGDMLYVPLPAVAKVAKDTGPTKKELLADLEKLVKVEYDIHKAFNGASKDAIQTVIGLATKAA